MKIGNEILSEWNGFGSVLCPSDFTMMLVLQALLRN